MKKSITVSLVGIAALAVAASVSCAQVPASPPTPPNPPSAPVPPAALPFALAENDDEPQAALQAAARELAVSQDALANRYALVGEKAWLFSGRPGVTDALVIPKDASDAQSLADMSEDLNVMARILEKALKPGAGKSGSAVYIPSPFGGSAGAPRNLYIEGYGALFLLNVNFPLVAPPAPKKEEAETKEQGDSEWEVTKRELYQPPGSGFDFKQPHVISSGRTAEKYDPEKVETLKKDLIEAFKNAAHIRKLKSDEVVTVTVLAPGPVVESKVATLPRMTSAPKPAAPDFKPIPKRAIRTASESRGAKLILRAKKSDIDAFQKDKLNLDDFRKKVNVMLLEGA